jgi:hypothetical protein
MAARAAGFVCVQEWRTSGAMHERGEGIFRFVVLPPAIQPYPFHGKRDVKRIKQNVPISSHISSRDGIMNCVY